MEALIVQPLAAHCGFSLHNIADKRGGGKF
jgi:hypothetical protein